MCRYNVDVRGMCHGNAALFIGKHLLAASASVEERNLGQVTLLRTFITFFIMFLDFLLLFLVLSFCITALNNYCTRRRRHMPCNISCSFCLLLSSIAFIAFLSRVFILQMLFLLCCYFNAD